MGEPTVSFERWRRGNGRIRHGRMTQQRVSDLAHRLGTPDFWDVLLALDRLTSAVMWLVVHATYARAVWLDGRDLLAEEFKSEPEGHTGGALNMVPAYAGYLAAGVLTGVTRAWLMGQGHCVAAIDATNVLAGNPSMAHAVRYAVVDTGLTRYVQDFYSYRLGDDGADVRGAAQFALGRCDVGPVDSTSRAYSSLAVRALQHPPGFSRASCHSRLQSRAK